MEHVTSGALARKLFDGETVTLGILPNTTRITLDLDRLTYHEGLWAIDLTRADGWRLFTIRFGWLDLAALMLGCVQAPPREIDGRACVRQLTEAAHGIRPAFLLMFVLRACARHWGVTRLIGVDEAHQVKGRWNHRAVKRHFDYTAFCQDLSGTRLPDGYWKLPVDFPRRPIEDVAMKRPATYRRRYALLDSLMASATKALS